MDKSENEGTKFWLGNFIEIKNPGVKDILIACSDNLTGMSDAITLVYPKTEHQICKTYAMFDIMPMN